MPKENEHKGNEKAQENFGLPDSYFQQSAAALMRRMDWLEEHKTYPQLGRLKGDAGFVTPENYFTASEVRLELVPYSLLQSLHRLSGFVVPESYFGEAELRNLPSVMPEGDPVISFDRRDPGFAVAEDYFAKQEARLKATLPQTEQVARVLPLISLRRGVLAAAALLLVTLGFWIYNAFLKPLPETDCLTMACIDRAELLKAPALESLEADELYELVNSTALEKNLETEQTKKNEKLPADSAEEPEADALDDLIDEI